MKTEEVAALRRTLPQGGAPGEDYAFIDCAVTAKASTAELNDWTKARGWSNLRLISSGGNSYNVEYFAEDEDGDQWPMMNVFVKDASGAVTLSWGSELFLYRLTMAFTTGMWNSFSLCGTSSI